MDLTRDFPARFYDQYYSGQLGGSGILPHYRPQRGRGIFGKIFRGFVLPTLGKAANVLKREAPKRLLSLGRDVLEDVADGKALGQSLKHRGLGQLKKAAGDILAPNGVSAKRRRRKTRQVGGARRRRRQRRAHHSRKTTRRVSHGVGKRRRSRKTRLPLFSRGRDIFA